MLPLGALLDFQIGGPRSGESPISSVSEGAGILPSVVVIGPGVEGHSALFIPYIRFGLSHQASGVAASSGVSDGLLLGPEEMLHG